MEENKNYCSKCGKEINKEWKYCNYCGNKLEGNEQKEEKIIENKNFKKLSIMILTASILVTVIKLFIEIDILEQIKYGDLNDFFNVLAKTIISVVIGAIIGSILVILINIFSKNTIMFKNPRKNVILGVIGSFISISYLGIYRGIYLGRGIIYASYIPFYGLAIYFIIVLFRIYKKMGSIQIANTILVLCHLLPVVVLFISIIDYDYFYLDVLESIYLLEKIIVLLYFFNTILLKKTSIINNKVFLIAILSYFLIELLNNNYIGSIFINIAYITAIPYFYNYYEILKGENKNDK